MPAVCRLQPHRSIPACAGEPTAPAAPAAPSPVYPRVCGGTVIEPSGLSTEPGLSPRVRGNRYGRRNGERDRGSIPACAGEPTEQKANKTLQKVYPRVCGGTPASVASKAKATGLSPRVRGNHVGTFETVNRFRSIPACAGEPIGGIDSARGQGVYPRVCGGTISGTTSGIYGRGLSPRVRGNQFRRHFRRGLRDCRSIPACAGEPIVAFSPFSAIILGLSPRVRGNPSLHAACAARLRSIPACAGEPRTVSGISPQEPVYPRVCGGTATRAQRVARIWGLSPRVRGNRPRPSSSLSLSGSIPACAGEPDTRSAG